MTALSNSIQVRPIASALGAEIHGIDLADQLSEAEVAAIRQAYHDHAVVFFRDQQLSPDQHRAVAKRFAPINVNRFFHPVDGHPDIAEVRKEPHQSMNIGSQWHTDHSYDTAPAMGSMLYALDVPDIGGDTMFASMYAAYDNLSDGLKATLEGLKAWHSSRHVFGAGNTDHETRKDGRVGGAEHATQDSLHPVVIHHPDTGRKALFVNPGFTLRFDGWTEAESKPLLDYLYQQAARPEITCRFRWEVGSLAFWDNRATWHLALNDYPGKRRLMHRITLEGVPLS